MKITLKKTAIFLFAFLLLKAVFFTEASLYETSKRRVPLMGQQLAVPSTFQNNFPQDLKLKSMNGFTPVHKNRISKDKYDLPETLFQIPGLNLIDLIGEAYIEFLKNADQQMKETLGDTLLFAIKGSAAYLQNAQGMPDWENFSDIDVVFYFKNLPDNPESIMKAFNSQLKNVFQTKGLVLKGDLFLVLYGKTGQGEKQWQFDFYLPFPVHSNLADSQSPGGYSLNFYHPNYNYFETSPEGRGADANLKQWMPEISLPVLFENTIKEYQFLFDHAIQYFEAGRPKAFKKVMELSQFLLDGEWYQSVYEEYLKYMDKDLFDFPSDEHEVFLKSITAKTETLEKWNLSTSELKPHHLRFLNKMRWRYYRDHIGQNATKTSFRFYLNVFDLNETEVNFIIGRFLIRILKLPLTMDELSGVLGKPMVRPVILYNDETSAQSDRIKMSSVGGSV